MKSPFQLEWKNKAQHKKQEALQNEQHRPPSPKERGKKLGLVTFSLDQKDRRR